MTPFTQRTLSARSPGSMAEVAAYLGGLTNYESQGPLSSWRRALGPARARRLLEELALLPVTAPVIQVAGSKGKGSTVLWMEALLMTRGITPGVMLSPHLTRLNERVRLAGRDICDEEILSSLAVMHDVLGRILEADADRFPTFFDLWTALAVQTFRQREVEVVLLEVGLGGPLDSTSAVPHDIGVLTTIDLEHCRELGDTVEEIATEKAGIARRGRPFVLARPESSAGRAALARARERGARVIPVGDDARIPSRVLSPQRHNLALALAALEALEGLAPFEEHEVAAAVARVSLPARLEELPGPPALLLDVAHTPLSLGCFNERLRSFRAGRPATVLMGLLESKEWRDSVSELVAEPSLRWIVTRPGSPRALAPEHLAGWLRGRGAAPQVVENPEHAIALLRARGDQGEAVAVTGSFYLAGLARTHWEEAGR